MSPRSFQKKEKTLQSFFFFVFLCFVRCRYGGIRQKKGFPLHPRYWWENHQHFNVKSSAWDSPGTNVCNLLIKTRNLSAHKKDVYWSSTCIIELRKSCTTKYKILKRNIKRKGPDALYFELEDYIQVKRALYFIIKPSKERCCCEVSGDVESFFLESRESFFQHCVWKNLSDVVSLLWIRAGNET